MPEALKLRGNVTVKRIYLDITVAADDMLVSLSADARVAKKRYVEALIEREFDKQKKGKNGKS